MGFLAMEEAQCWMDWQVKSF